MRFLPPALRALAAWACLAAFAAAEPVPLPPTPSPTQLLSARPVRLEAPLPVPGRPDLEPSRQAWLVVVQAEPAACRPRQTAEPVLFAGSTRAARLNHGWPEGRVVALLVGDRDLSAEVIWFGEPGLPERVGPEDIAEQARRAEAAGLRPPTAAELAAARAAGGGLLEVEGPIQPPPQAIEDLGPAIRELFAVHDPSLAARLPAGAEDRP